MAGLSDKTVDILDTSSDEDNEPTQQETKQKEKAQKENRTKNKLYMTQTATRYVKADNQNDAQIGMDKISWYQKLRSQRERRKPMNRS